LVDLGFSNPVKKKLETLAMFFKENNEKTSPQLSLTSIPKIW
jgi:hypothetical protein